MTTTFWLSQVQKRVEIGSQLEFDTWQWCEINGSHTLNWNTASAVFSLETQEREVLSIPKEAGGKTCPEEKGKRANLFVCLWGSVFLLQKHPAIPHSHIHMLNDSIYSPCHHIFISLSFPWAFPLSILTSKVILWRSGRARPSSYL